LVVNVESELPYLIHIIFLDRDRSMCGQQV